MTSRPQVSIYGNTGEIGTLAMPAVFKDPIRLIVICAVHTKLAKNRRRQPYAVSAKKRVIRQVRSHGEQARAVASYFWRWNTSSWT